MSDNFQLSKPAGQFAGHWDIESWAKNAGVTDPENIKKLKDLADAYWNNGYAAAKIDLWRFLNVPRSNHVDVVVYDHPHFE